MRIISHAIICLSLLLPVEAVEKQFINANISGWDVSIDYTAIDNNPSGVEPVTRVLLSHPSLELEAQMEVPFNAFFALWDHLDLLSTTEAARSPVVLPAGRDGVILQEGNKSFKLIVVDEAALLVRLWLDVFQRNWNGTPGDFGYLLRHNPFPSGDNFLGGLPQRYAKKGSKLPQTNDKMKKQNKSEMATPRKPSD